MQFVSELRLVQRIKSIHISISHCRRYYFASQNCIICVMERYLLVILEFQPLLYLGLFWFWLLTASVHLFVCKPFWIFSRESRWSWRRNLGLKGGHVSPGISDAKFPVLSVGEVVNIQGVSSLISLNLQGIVTENTNPSISGLQTKFDTTKCIRSAYNWNSKSLAGWLMQCCSKASRI